MTPVEIMEVADKVYEELFAETELKFKALEKRIDVGPSGRIAHQERLDGMRKFYIALIKELYKYDA